MASSAALDLIVSLKGDAEKGIGGLSKSILDLGKGAVGVGATLTKAIGGIALGGAVAGVGALGAALVSGIADAREAGQVMAATENVIKSMGRTGQFSAEQISEMAASLSAAEGMSLFGDSDIQAGQNMLLTFANINEVLPEATQAMVDMTQFMGGDMVGASTMLGKALDNPTQGLSALSRVGVSFSEQQKEQIKVMQEAGNMAGAQGVILDALKSQFGGAALAAAQADGGWAMFRDRMGEIAEGVGARLLPSLNLIPQALNSPEVMAAIEGFASGLATGIGGAISWLIDTGVPLFVTGVSGIATAINDWVITPAKNVVAAFNEWKAFGTEWGIVAALNEIGETFPVVQPLTDWLANQAPGLVQGVREAFGLAKDAFITFRDALAGDWAADPEKIHPLHLAIGEFGTMIHDEVLPRITDLVNYVKDEAPAAWETFKESIDEDVIPALEKLSDLLGKQKDEDLPATTISWKQFGDDLATTLNEAMTASGDFGAFVRSEFLKQAEAAKENWTSIGTNIDEALTLLTASVTTTYNLIVSTTQDKLTEVAGTFSSKWSEITTTVSAKIDEAIAFVAAIPGRVTGAIANAGSLLTQVGKDMIQGLIDGLKSLNPGSILGGILQGAIATAKAAIQSKSPSKLTRDVLGKPIIDGVIAGIEDRAPAMSTALVSSLHDLVGKAKAAAAEVGDAITGGFAVDPVSMDRKVKLPYDEAVARLDKMVDAYADASKRLKVPADEATAHLSKLVGAVEKGAKLPYNEATARYNKMVDAYAEAAKKLKVPADEATAHLDKMVGAVDRAGKGTRVAAEQVEAHLRKVVGSLQNTGEKIKMPVEAVESHLRKVVTSLQGTASDINLTAPTMMEPLTNALGDAENSINTAAPGVLMAINALVNNYNDAIKKIKQPEFFGGYAGPKTPYTPPTAPMQPPPTPYNGLNTTYAGAGRLAAASMTTAPTTITYETGAITIIQQPGEDPRQLAERLMPELDRMQRQRRFR